jgi:hypothetical protein
VGSSADLLDRFAHGKPPAGWPTSPRRTTSITGLNSAFNTGKSIEKFFFKENRF